MKYWKLLRFGVGVSVAGIMAFGAGSAIANTASHPPPPPWVGPDGKVDKSKMPQCINILDKNGNLIKDKKTGKLACKTPDEILAGPTGEPQLSSPQQETIGSNGEIKIIVDAPALPPASQP